VPIPTISGPTSICINSGFYNYTTEPGMLNYNWTVSSGGVINYGLGTNQIQVSWMGSGIQMVSVSYTNTYGCAALTPAVLNVNVNPLPDPAGIITGTDIVCAGDNGIMYSVAPVVNATAYVWFLSPNATILSGSGTNSITVNYGTNAISGNIYVSGNNLCGNGPGSPAFPVLVNALPDAPVVTNTGPLLHSNTALGNQWYFQGNLLSGASLQNYLATQNGYYWDVVTVGNCSSDTSNHKLIILEGVEPILSTSINVYPNPNNGQFFVNITSPSSDPFSISIYTNLGLLIYEESNIKVVKSLLKVIDLTDKPAGVYLVIINNKENHVMRKIIATDQ